MRAAFGYAVGTLVQAASGFVLIPLFLNALGAENYASWVLYEPAISVLAQIVLLGANHNIIKVLASSPIGLGRIWKRAVARVIFPSAALLLISWPLHESLNLVAAGFAVIVEAIYVMQLAICRGLGRPFSFAVTAIAKVSCIMVFITVFEDQNSTIASLLYVQAAAGVLAILIANAKNMVNRTKHDSSMLSPDPFAIQQSLSYGLPLTVGAVISIVIASADRYFLEHALQPAELAEYVVTLKIAAAITALLMPLSLWFPAARFQHEKDTDSGVAFFRQVGARAALYAAVCMSCLLSAGPEIMKLLMPSASLSVPLLAGFLLAASLQTLSNVFNVGLLNSGQTRQILKITMLLAVVQITALCAAFPWLDSTVAVIIQMFVAFSLFFLQVKSSQRLLFVPHGWVTIGITLLSVPIFFVITSKAGVGRLTLSVTANGVLLPFLIFMNSRELGSNAK